MRRAGVLSLIVALFALSGASVAPTRGLAGTNATAIVWQARETKNSQVARAVRRQTPVSSPHIAPLVASTAAHLPAWFVRHALFQRPPPASRRT